MNSYALGILADYAPGPLVFELCMPLIAVVSVVCLSTLLLPRRTRSVSVLSIYSLVLCVVVGVMWARTWRYNDCVALYIAGRGVGYSSEADGAHLLVLPSAWEPCSIVELWVYRVRWRRFERAWFKFDREYYAPYPYHFIVPHWAIMLPLLVAPDIYLRGHLRIRRRKKLGLCVKCGYDLRATPERCPECGKPARPAVIANGKGDIPPY